MTIFYAYLINNTNRDDDDVLKIEARDKKTATEFAKERAGVRFTFSDTYTATEFRKAFPDWYSLIRSWKAERCQVQDERTLPVG